MTLTRESLDANGKPICDRNGTPAYEPGVENPVTVYTSTLDNGEQYSMVYGNSKASNIEPSGKGGGEYGNSVLLGPGSSIPRDEKGAIIPGSIKYQALGHDPSDGEARTAVGVNFKTKNGERATAVSAHLTADSKASKSEQQKAQREQYNALKNFASSFGSNVIIGGDFNSAPGRNGVPSADDLGLNQADDLNGIDHILTSRGVTEGSTERKEGGGSDHEMVITDVTLQ